MKKIWIFIALPPMRGTLFAGSETCKMEGTGVEMSLTECEHLPRE